MKGPLVLGLKLLIGTHHSGKIVLVLNADCVCLRSVWWWFLHVAASCLCKSLHTLAIHSFLTLTCFFPLHGGRKLETFISPVQSRFNMDFWNRTGFSPKGIPRKASILWFFGVTKTWPNSWPLGVVIIGVGEPHTKGTRADRTNVLNSITELKT